MRKHGGTSKAPVELPNRVSKPGLLLAHILPETRYLWGGMVKRLAPYPLQLTFATSCLETKGEGYTSPYSYFTGGEGYTLISIRLQMKIKSRLRRDG